MLSVSGTPVRSRASLGRVLDDLGPTLLRPLHGSPARSVPVGGAVLYDPDDEQPIPAGALVLAVGLRAQDAAPLLEDLGRQGAAALVVRMPRTVTADVAAAADRSGVPLLGLARGAPWMHLLAVLRSLTAAGEVTDPGEETLGGVPSGDLFALANAVASLLDAPITIEDQHSRVLAFSGRQDEADQPRVETILGRQVPERYRQVMAERGVFHDVARSRVPVYVEPVDPGTGGPGLPRMVLAVRAGDEVLGSIWAAVREPLRPARAQAMVDCAKLVALHLLRRRAGADVERRLRTELVATAVEGGPGAAEALSRLGLLHRPVVVLALGLPGTDDADSPADEHARRSAERDRLTDAFALHASAAAPMSAVALINDVTYGLVPFRSADADAAQARATSIATDFQQRVGTRVAPLIGVGTVAAGVAELRRSRAQADRALRVLRSGDGRRRVATMADVHVQALLLELEDLIAVNGDAPTGPVARLLDYDAAHGGQLTETLRAWLENFGDVIAASASVHTHPNTFRYRLRRVAEVGGLDLTDADARIAAMLQLRLMVPRESGR